MVAPKTIEAIVPPDGRLVFDGLPPGSRARLVVPGDAEATAPKGVLGLIADLPWLGGPEPTKPPVDPGKLRAGGGELVDPFAPMDWPDDDDEPLSGSTTPGSAKPA